MILLIIECVSLNLIASITRNQHKEIYDSYVSLQLLESRPIDQLHRKTVPVLGSSRGYLELDLDQKKKRESFHSGARFPEAALVSRQPIDRLYFRLPLRKEERGARSSVAGHACIELAGQRAT